MTKDEMTAKAREIAKEHNPPGITEPDAYRQPYENFLDGTLIPVTYRDNNSIPQYSYVYFRDSVATFYRNSSDVLNIVDNYKERTWFFRFLKEAGIGGLIAFMLIIILSALLCLSLFVAQPQNSTYVVDVIKLSFPVILGYFFGQASGKKATS
jgi:hypothetical protein